MTNEPRDSVDAREFTLIIGRIDGKLDALIIQTTATNGRVTKLELHQAFVTGAVAVLTLIAASGGAWLVFLSR